MFDPCIAHHIKPNEIKHLAETLGAFLLPEPALAGSTYQLIISSSWRFHYPLEELRQMPLDGLAHRVVGRTGPALAVKHARYQELKAF
jgi:hypothetical protein